MVDPNAATLPPPAAEPLATGHYAGPDTASALVPVLDRYLAELQTGAAPRREDLLARHPELASQLEKCLSGIEFIHRAAQTGEAPTRLGDFRIVREIGRGGMGVVYEAEQVSLQRRVALKVLRFGGVADQEALERFQREARAVAHLHHTNIVPIFAVDCENGVHYYAMQYIEGRSLDSAIGLRQSAAGQSAEHRQPTADGREVARWCLHAAEALDHAHQRGVIHRDVKPSNLLLDNEGTVWLTDFGLARRMDEVTVTAAGVLMGTPRYMSPEQASAAQQPIDHRTDIYSLGATLYELATGRPVFSADTPQGVISQILLDEPRAPRLVCPSLPRDLETIIVKCLEKDPAKRYQAARDLADDLRAFLEGRTIKARRVSVFERSRRWAVKHRGSALLMAGAAVASALLIFLGTGVFQQYQAWQQGGLLFWTDGQVLVGELQDNRGWSVLPRFTVPNVEALSVHAGSYDLRLSGRGFLDMRCKVLVERGPYSAYQLGLEEQRLGEPVRTSRTFEVAELEGRHDLLLLTEEGVVRRDAASGRDIWKVDLRKSSPGLAHFRWDWKEPGYPSGRGGFDYRLRLVKPLPDLDGDGVGDLIWASQRQAALLALSGKDGKVLWLSPDPLPEDQRMSTNNDSYDRGSRGAVVGVPVTADVDGDGTPDIIAAFIAWDRRDRGLAKPPERWVAATSGRTGKALWRYDLDPAWLTPSDGGEIPMTARWSPGPGRSSGGGFHSDASLLYEMSFMECTDAGPALPYPPTIINLNRKTVVALGVGSRLLGLELATGKPAWPAHDLGFWPVRPPQFAELKGDGTLQAVFLHPEKPPAKLNDDHLALTALDLATRTTLWQTAFRGYWRWNWYEQPFDWPLIEDLDGDRKSEIIVPTAERTARSLWSGLELLDGPTGQVRWQKPIVLSSSWGRILQVDRFAVGPDIDGDQARDIFAVSLDAAERSESINFPILIAGLTDPDKDPTRPVVVVDALSGRDGHGLWFTRQPMKQGSLTYRPGPGVSQPRWWDAGSEGVPQLVVSYLPDTPHEGGLPSTTLVLSTRSGEVLRTGQDLREADAADLDGDGIAELFAYRPTTPSAFDDGGVIDIIRGRSSQCWCLLGGHWQLAGDLNGDGIRDLISDHRTDSDQQTLQGAKAARERRARTDKPRLRSVSGADGRLLWQTEMQDGWSPTDIWTHAFPAAGPNADLDGDGIEDLFAIPSEGLYVMDPRPLFGPGSGTGHGFSPLLAISGRTGQRLWTADLRVNVQMGCQFHACRDLDGDGRPEVIFVSRMDYGYDRQSGNWSSNHGQLWLVVLDGRTGKVRWLQALNERGTNANEMQDADVRPVFVELTGDGVQDIVIPAGRPIFGSAQVRAYSGKDGAELWTWSEEAPRASESNSSSWPRLNVGDLNGDGRPEIIILHLAEKTAQGTNPQREAVVRLLDGVTGKENARWSAPVDYDFNRPDSSRERRENIVTPQVVRLGAGRQAVCVWTYHYKSGSQLVLLDADGKELRKTAVKFALGGEARRHIRELNQKADSYLPGADWAIFRVWVNDLDGDGVDELLWYTDEKLQAVRNDLQTVLWTSPMRGDLNKLLEIIPSAKGRPGTILVQSDQRVQCLSAATGQPILTCLGTGKLAGIMDTKAQPPTHFLYDHGSEVVSSSQGQLHGAESSAGPRSAVVEDTRVTRPLPWQNLEIVPREARVRPLPQTLLGATLVSAGFALLVLVMPATLLVWGLRQRHWPSIAGAVVWFTLAVIGVSASIVVQYGDEAQWSVQLAGWWSYLRRLTTNVMMISVLGLPTVAFVAAVVLCLWRGRWSRLAALLLVSAALAAVIGWAVLTFVAPPLELGQQYSWRGWYAIWPAGPYAIGCLMLTGAAVLWVGRLLRAAKRRLFSRGPVR